MSGMVLKNGLVVDPSQNIKQIADIRIENGLVAEIGTGLHGEQELDLTGLVVFPGFVDMHVHFRDPGLTYKEDIFSGCRAAAAGGVTSVACMPNTKPAVDTPETVRYIVDKASHADAHVYPVAAITKGLSGVEMTDFAALKAAGAIGVSDDGRPVEDAAMMQRALELAERNRMKIISHCEDLAIINGGIINEGKVSRAMGLKGMHRSSEDSVTAREIALAAATDTAIHIAHVSTKGSVALIRDAKARGIRVTAETAPHYFMLTDELLFKRDADYRMNPPLREQEDCDAVLEGVLDGTLDCIVTDHAPHTPEEKADFEKAPNGVVGLETSFSACMTALVQTGKLSISGLIERMSLNPARLLGIRAGSLAVGMPADIAVADLNERWTVDVDKLHSKSRNSVFKRMTLQGKIKYTLLDGRLVYNDNSSERKADAE